jgi:hypothetical protein|mmetsp:Transcript_6403/g.21595  ORF Transcript_6403/g.21595 Transcript_6403/m.21595 type:complete len:335 (-) Transcript_6403:100-1104(-)
MFAHSQRIAPVAARVTRPRTHEKHRSMSKVPRKRELKVQASSTDDESAIWYSCVVIENNAASVDGSQRSLVVAVEDKQNDDAQHLRSSPGLVFNNGKVWTETFTKPGMYVKARFGRGDGGGDGVVDKLPVARSPYHVRYDSARLDSAKVEFLVDAGTHPAGLTAAKPGDVISVSKPLGSGFTNVLFAERSLEAAMKKNHALVLVARGTSGMASIRSILDWQPVLAYTDKHPVTVFYLANSQESSALLSLHDEWRSEGYKIIPVYGGVDDVDNAMFMIEQCLLTGALTAGGKPTILGKSPASCSVLLAGCQGDVASKLLHLFDSRGVSKENILTD